MFSPDHPNLSESQIQGLFGELTFIVEESTNRGIDTVIESWCGIDYEEVDFVFPDYWAEIKARSRLKSTITISSPGQLDHAIRGQLIVYSVDRDSTGESLNDLFQRILEMIRKKGSQILEENFRRRLEDFGYFVLPIYDTYKFIVTEKRVFAVTDSFPRVSREIMIPNIKTLKYELLINLNIPIDMNTNTIICIK